MNHAITIGGLLLSVGVLAGFFTFAGGILSLFGNMMADAAGDDGKSGCIMTVIGSVLFVGCLIGLLA